MWNSVWSSFWRRRGWMEEDLHSAWQGECLMCGKTIINHPFGNGLYHLFMVIWGMVYYCFIHIQYMTSHNSGQTSSTTVFSSCAGAPLTVSPKRLQFRCPKLENTAWEGAQATYVDYMRGNIHKKKLPCWTHCRHSGLPLTTSFIVLYYSRERTISSPRTNKFH